MKLSILQTENLELIAATHEHIHAELESPENLSSILKTEINSEWPPGEYDRDAQKFFYDCLKNNDSSLAGWYIWYAVRRAKPDVTALLIGAGGYFGPPNENGTVEIGFSVVPSQRKKGYATEIAKALIDNAFNDKRVHKVIAHTNFHNKASCKVLEKSGFHYVFNDNEPENILYERFKQNH